jgi:hypothetical protein
MVIHLHDRRVQAAGLVQKLQHAIAGFPLLMVGFRRLTAGEEPPLALLEVAIAAMVLGTFARQVYTAGKKHAPHSKVDWFDLAAAAMMMFEAFHGHHHKPPYLTPQFCTAVVTAGMALFHEKIHARRTRRRYVKVDDNGLEVRAGLFRRFSLGWSDVDRIHIGPDKAVFLRNNGKQHIIGFRMLRNDDEVRKHISEHARAAGVNLTTIS